MSGSGPNSAEAAATRDWEAVRASAEIQFAPMPPIKPPETPAWLEWLSKVLRAMFGPLAEGMVAAWPWIQKGLIVLALVLVAYLAWRLLRPLVARWRGRAPAGETWAPSREEALALLDDADRLAAEGRFGEAAHLLLLRSVGQIRARRPDTLIPASTAREIATLPQLPQAARTAFAVIAERVERCLFGLRDLDAGDWQAARTAYSQFALADLRG